MHVPTSSATSPVSALPGSVPLGGESSQLGQRAHLDNAMGLQGRSASPGPAVSPPPREAGRPRGSGWFGRESAHDHPPMVLRLRQLIHAYPL